MLVTFLSPIRPKRLLDWNQDMRSRSYGSKLHRRRDDGGGGIEIDDTTDSRTEKKRVREEEEDEKRVRGCTCPTLRQSSM